MSKKRNLSLGKRSASKSKYEKPADLSNYVFGKVQPQALPLEKAVLGALMLDEDALPIILDILHPESFYSYGHQMIFRAMLKLFEKSLPIDLLTVAEELKKAGDLKAVGGPNYLAELTNRVISSVNIEIHAKIVRDKYMSRELIEICTYTIKKVFEEEGSVLDLLNESTMALSNLKSKYIGKNLSEEWILENGDKINPILNFEKLIEDFQNLKEEQLKIKDDLDINFSRIRKFIYDLAEEGSIIGLKTGYIYLGTDNEEKANLIFEKFKRFIHSLNIPIAYEDEPKYGSWTKKIVIRIKNVLNKKEVKDRLKDGEHALKLAMIDKTQSEVDLNQARAASELINATKDESNCIFQIGSLIFLKCQDKNGKHIQLCKTLRRSEMKMISENPDLLENPIEMYLKLKSIELKLIDAKVEENTKANKD